MKKFFLFQGEIRRRWAWLVLITASMFGSAHADNRAVIDQDCGLITCSRVETTYADGEVSKKAIRTDWKVCEAQSTATNLKSAQTYSVRIHDTYIEFLEPPTVPNQHGTNPVAHGFYACRPLVARR
jgi:hypothetical protein